MDTAVQVANRALDYFRHDLTNQLRTGIVLAPDEGRPRPSEEPRTATDFTITFN